MNSLAQKKPDPFKRHWQETRVGRLLMLWSQAGRVIPGLDPEKLADLIVWLRRLEGFNIGYHFATKQAFATALKEDIEFLEQQRYVDPNSFLLTTEGHRWVAQQTGRSARKRRPVNELGGKIRRIWNLGPHGRHDAEYALLTRASVGGYGSVRESPPAPLPPRHPTEQILWIVGGAPEQAANQSLAGRRDDTTGQLYGVSIVAHINIPAPRGKVGVRTHNHALLILAEPNSSEAEVKAWMRDYTLRKWPPHEGWHGHGIDIVAATEGLKEAICRDRKNS